MTPESTALALVVEKLIAEGVDPADIDLEEIQASDSFTDLIEQVQTVIEDEGDVTEDPDVIALAGNIAEEIINPPAPPSPPAAAVIDIAAIEGVTAPVTGVIPVTTITETAQYTGTVAWLPADSPFLGEVVYEATITLTPKTGFTLTGVTADFFTVAGATPVTNAANSGVVTATFPETAAVPVEVQSAEQTGGTSGTVDSTGLTLTFDVDPTTLAASDITLTGATKGALSGTGTTRSLAISDITVSNGETVSVAIADPSGFTISGSPQTAVVYRAPYIGMAYQGGIVAYIFVDVDTGYVLGETHGLIAAAADQSDGIVWSNIYATEVGANAQGTAIGTGQANTAAIVGQAGCESGAAYLCYHLTEGGYSDWFLPSKDELNKLYLNRAEIGGFAGSYYWSSSEYSASYAWYQNFVDGSQASTSKNMYRRVRAVRAF